MDLEISFVFLELDECLMVDIFFWQEECETKCQETYEEHQNIWIYYEYDLEGMWR